MTTRTVIDECGLENFRRQHLSPGAILSEVERHVSALYRLPVGVGKSLAGDRLTTDPHVYEAFGFVIYLAPTWRILEERSILAGAAESPVPWMTLRPRPREDCGHLDKEWTRLERLGCSALAKATLCKGCPKMDESPPCPWPSQHDNLKRSKLLFATEQQLVLNRSLISYIRQRIGPSRILVILDEARLLDKTFGCTITAVELSQFRVVIQNLPRFAEQSTWLKAIHALQQTRDPRAAKLNLAPWLNRDALEIQAKGQKRIGPTFRYLGYDLGAFSTSHPPERSRTENGDIHFVARPYLGCHLLILSAHLTGDHVGVRLGRDAIHSPFEHTTFQHSGTRLFNIRSRSGADNYFAGNHKQILDTFAVLIARNLLEDRTTLLVSRKKTKDKCAKYLQDRLAGWGHRVELVTTDYATLPASPNPFVIPIIHYGVFGVNEFSDYECAYCLNSYYISSRTLERAVLDGIPGPRLPKIELRTGTDLVRHAVVTEGANLGQVFARTASTYLRKLEVDPVIQAVGRVRFVTKPREVILFQTSDLSHDLGPHRDVTSFAELRELLGVPEAKFLDRAWQLLALQSRIADGWTVKAAAAEIGISRPTAFRRLSEAESLKNHIRYIFCMGIETPPPSSDGQEAVR